MKKENPKEKGDKKSEDKNSLRIQELETALKEAEHKRLSALADYQNLQKRIEKEKEELSYLLVSSLLDRIVEIKEDLERLNENDKHEGVKAILDKLNMILMERGVQGIEVSSGDEVDPEVMEVVTTVETDDKDRQGKVFEVLQMGYKLNTGRIIRSAKVVVGKTK